MRADELAQLLVDFARRSGVDLAEKRVEEILRDGEIRAGGVKYRGKVVILATGITATEVGIPREVEFADHDGGIIYRIPDPSRFRGKRESFITGTSPHPGRISFESTRELSISLDLTGDL